MLSFGCTLELPGGDLKSLVPRLHLLPVKSQYLEMRVLFKIIPEDSNRLIPIPTKLQKPDPRKIIETIIEI